MTTKDLCACEEYTGENTHYQVTRWFQNSRTKPGVQIWRGLGKLRFWILSEFFTGFVTKLIVLKKSPSFQAKILCEGIFAMSLPWINSWEKLLFSSRIFTSCAGQVLFWHLLLLLLTFTNLHPDHPDQTSHPNHQEPLKPPPSVQNQFKQFY